MLVAFYLTEEANMDHGELVDERKVWTRTYEGSEEIEVYDIFTKETKTIPARLVCVVPDRVWVKKKRMRVWKMKFHHLGGE